MLEFDLGPGNLMQFEKKKSAILKFCKVYLENVELALKIVNTMIELSLIGHFTYQYIGRNYCDLSICIDLFMIF